MKGLMKLLAVAVVLLSGVEAQAGGTGTEVTITRIVVNSTGVLPIYVSGPVSGHPSCATSSQGFAVDGSTKVGALFASVALTAHAVSSSVTVTGTGTCSVTPGWETLNTLEILQDKQAGQTAGGLRQP